jgi:hypothetical protein
MSGFKLRCATARAAASGVNQATSRIPSRSDGTNRIGASLISNRYTWSVLRRGCPDGVWNP